MKHTFLATLIAMLFALSFVACDKGDEPKQMLHSDTIVNALPFDIALNIDQWFVYLKAYEGTDFHKIKPDDKGVVMLNADLAYRGEYDRKDSMIVVKDYPLIPVNKEIDGGGSKIYSVNYYTITEEVFRDIIVKMKERRIEPTKYDYDYFAHIGKVFKYNNYKNTSSYDISFQEPISETIVRNENVDSPINDNLFMCKGQQYPHALLLNCTLYYTDHINSYSLEISDYIWDASDYQSDTDGLNTTETFYFVFTDKLLESIKSCMAEKNVFPQEVEFSKE
jgi:hypothetical protein